MPEKLFHPSRPWRQIAYELAHEMDAKRLTELSRELSQAIDEQMLPEKYGSNTIPAPRKPLTRAS